ncbi:hypothetical protein LguiA_024343 [Lonicera macranthoides]
MKSRFATASSSRRRGRTSGPCPPRRSPVAGASSTASGSDFPATFSTLFGS